MSKKILIILLFLSPVAWSANEIQMFSPGITTAYYTVRNLGGQIWYPVGLVFEAYGTGGRTAADYDLALTNKTAGMWVGNFDTNIAVGNYWASSYYQAGGVPADTDPVVWVEFGNWTGSTWTATTVTPTTIADAVWDELSTGHTDAGKAGRQLWTYIDAILADTNELQTDWTDGGRLDLLIDAIKYKTDLLTLLDTTVKGPNDANNFTLTAGPDANSVYQWHIIMVQDATAPVHYEMRYIVDWEYDGVDIHVTVQTPFTFTPAALDVVHVIGTDYEAIFWRNLIDGPIYRINYSAGPGGTQFPGVTQFEDSEDP